MLHDPGATMGDGKGLISGAEGELRSSRPPPPAAFSEDEAPTTRRAPAGTIGISSGGISAKARRHAPPLPPEHAQPVMRSWSLEKRSRVLDMPAPSKLLAARRPPSSVPGIAPAVRASTRIPPPPRPARIETVGASACAVCAALNATNLRYCRSCGLDLTPGERHDAPAGAPPPAAATGAPAIVVDARPRVHPPEPASPPEIELEVAAESVVDDDAFDLASLGILSRATLARRRWKIRIFVLMLLIAGELGVAHRTGSLRVPHDIVPRTIGRALQLLR